MSEAIIEEYSEVSTELAPAAPQTITASNNEQGYFCSMPTKTREDALELARALTNAEELEGMIGRTLHLHDYVLQPVTVTDQRTGEIRNCTRIVLMCDEGNFGTISTGVETSMRNLCTAMKNFPAPWNPPIEVVPTKQQGKNGFKFTQLDF